MQSPRVKTGAIRAQRSWPSHLKSLHWSDFAYGRFEAHQGGGGHPVLGIVQERWAGQLRRLGVDFDTRRESRATPLDETQTQDNRGEKDQPESKDNGTLGGDFWGRGVWGASVGKARAVTPLSVAANIVMPRVQAITSSRNAWSKPCTTPTATNSATAMPAAPSSQESAKSRAIFPRSMRVPISV